MISVAVYGGNPAIRERLAALAGKAGVRITGSADDPRALARLLDAANVDVILTQPPVNSDLGIWLADRRARFVVLVEDGDTAGALEALHAGAAAVVPASVNAREIQLAIEAAGSALGLVPRQLLGLLLGDDRPDHSSHDATASDVQALTPRELDVLAALADGASNKMIARRLGISFHTVKFHVASILEKLDADSRTEAVAEAARRGLVML